MKKQLCLIALSFLFSIMYSNVHAGKDTLRLILIDGYTNLPIQNEEVRIILHSKKNKNIDEFNVKSNDSGLVLFTYSTTKQLTLHAKIKGLKFIEMYRTLWKNDLNKDLIHFPFYPTSSYEQEMLKQEDVKYGRVKYQSIENLQFNEDLKEENVEEKPFTPAEYPGGPQALQLHIATTVVYPQVSIEMNEQGKVYCAFVVEPDGFISHVEVVKSLSKELDQEAKRLVRSMPLWLPGADEDGIVGRTKCFFPINFTLK